MSAVTTAISAPPAGAVAPAVTLSITPTPAAPGPVLRNTDITYVITAKNAAGADDATNVEVTFPTPLKTTLGTPAPAASTGGTPPTTVGGDVKTTFATLGGGASGTLTVVVHVDPTATKTAGPANDIVANASATFGPGTNNAPPVSVAHELTAAADLTLSIAPVPPPPIVSQKQQPVDVTVTVGNLGPDPATGTNTVTLNLTGTGTIDTTGSGCTSVTAVKATCSFTGLAAAATTPFTVKVNAANPATVTVTASLATTGGAEIDGNPANNADVSTTIEFKQSTSNLSITTALPGVDLIFDGPTKDVTFTLSTTDPPPNGGDPSENVKVEITIPLGVTATGFSVVGGLNSCVLPGGPGGTVVCQIGNVNVGSAVTVNVTLKGTALPGGGTLSATATPTTNIDPDLSDNTATRVVTVVPQPVDLSVNNILDAIVTTAGPAVTTASKDFTVTVSNSPTSFLSGPFTVVVDLPTPAPGLTLGSPTPGCSASSGNTVLTCSGTGLAAGASKDFVITATIAAAGPITLRSTVTVTSPTQIDPSSANNTDTWSVTRNIPPNPQADVGPTVPAGATLVFDVLNNDTDADAADVANLAVQTPVPGAGDLAISLDGKKLKVVVPAGEAPATFDLGYKVVDGRGGETASMLKVKVVAAPAFTVNGSFAKKPATPKQSFKQDIPTALLADSVNTFDLLGGDLGKRADGSPFAVAPAPGATTYALTSVSSVAVTGSTATVPGGAVTDPKMVTYVPAPGYTSDPPTRNKADLGCPPPPPAPPAQCGAPPDSFKYLATGTKDNTQLFTVDSTVSIEVRNQQPIGVDTLINISPGSAPVEIFPASDDIDGNSGVIPVQGSGQFTFDDAANADSPHALQILCIGPPTLDPTTKEGKRPVAPPNCTDAAMKGPGQALVVPAPNGTGNITATLGADFKKVTVSIDAKVSLEVPFVAVVVDNYGGAGWSEVLVTIPDQPTQVLPGRVTVPMNSPPVVVLKTQGPGGVATDPNGAVVVTSITQPAHGKAEITDGKTTITYTPATGYVGPDSLDLNVGDGSGAAGNSAQLNIDVVPPSTQPVAVSSSPGAAGGAAAAIPGAGALAKTGGDPVPLTVAAACSLLLGFALVLAGRRRQTLPLLAQARHLRA